ncbi:MAG: hypothetical protein SOZ32_01140 [Bacilli bacterium]|nr:hypothetical protein [Mollicutes bacterium]MDY3898807.1 hypothetical protein [Bacilli bacterium]
MGLSVVKAIVLQHKDKINVTTTNDSTITFTITL